MSEQQKSLFESQNIGHTEFASRRDSTVIDCAGFAIDNSRERLLPLKRIRTPDERFAFSTY